MRSQLVWTLVAVVALAVAAPADVTVTRLDGTTATGQLERWSADAIALSTAEGSLAVASGDVSSIKFSKDSAADRGRPLLELLDGSLLPVGDAASDGKKLKAMLQTSAAAKPQPLSVPLDQVRSIRLLPLAAEVLPQWREIHALRVPSDLVVVSKRGGKSLDHLECVVGKITPDEVELEVDGKPLKVPRSKIAGIIYYRSDDAADVSPQCQIVGRDGMRIAASSVDWHGDTLELRTPSGLALSWPLGDVVSADLSAGKVVFLSDLEPAAVRWQPLVGLPAAAKQAAQYGRPHFDQSADGGPLTLAHRDKDPAVATPTVQSFAKGIALRSRAELAYRLPRGYARLLALAGIEPSTAANGNVTLAIYGDGRLLWERAVAGGDAPLAIDLDVKDVRRLKLVVDYGQNLDTGDWLNLCNARIVK